MGQLSKFNSGNEDLSMLVNISQLTVCSQYDYQLCAFSIWKKHSIDPNLLECFTSSKKFAYYTGYVQTKHGITLHPQYYGEDHQKKKVSYHHLSCGL